LSKYLFSFTEILDDMQVKYSVSKENYLKTVYHLQHNSEAVSTNALAEALQTRPASVTDMLKKLTAQNLLQYENIMALN
jgi:DtxR family Mn-dependent transcriptional regulator